MIDPKLVSKVRSWFDDPQGWCYVASEAIYHLAGGKKAGIKPMQAYTRIPEGSSYAHPNAAVSHWWLQDEDGSIVDATADQFDFPFPYELGRGRGFTGNTKNDTKELIEWVRNGCQ